MFARATGVGVHVLHLLVGPEALGAQLTTDARLLVATEGPLRVDEVEVVHPHRAGAHAVGDALGTLDVGGLHAAGKAVDRVVGDGHRLVVGLERDHAQHRAEDLLLGDLRRVVDLEKIVGWKNASRSRCSARPSGLRATDDRLADLVTTELHVALDRLDLATGHERPEVGGEVHRVAQHDLAGPLDEQAHELVVDRLVHQRPGARLAHLAVVQERAPQHDAGGDVEVGVVEHDVGRLATELEGHRLHGARTRAA